MPSSRASGSGDRSTIWFGPEKGASRRIDDQQKYELFKFLKTGFEKRGNSSTLRLLLVSVVLGAWPPLEDASVHHGAHSK
jgi:hypothetical protein